MQNYNLKKVSEIKIVFNLKLYLLYYFYNVVNASLVWKDR